MDSVHLGGEGVRAKSIQPVFFLKVLNRRLYGSYKKNIAMDTAHSVGIGMDWMPSKGQILVSLFPPLCLASLLPPTTNA